MHKIMIIDDNITSLAIAKSALESNYIVIPVTSGEQAFKLLHRMKELPDLILLDIDMPELNGFSVISKLKTNPKVKDIPVVFLTVQDDSASELEGFSLGAVDYIKKPFSIPLLNKRIELQLQIIEQTKSIIEQKKLVEEYSTNLEVMVAKKNETVLELQYAIITTVSDLIGKRDGYTGEHVIRTQKYLEILTHEMINRGFGETLTEQDVDVISLTSRLHDVGKIAISDNVLRKELRLDANEFECMKMHTTIGAEAIERSMKLTKENDFLKFALQMAKSHHEKWDGTGYPEGLSGKEIPLVARILAVADTYDALTTKRKHNKPMIHEEAVKVIKGDSGTYFDPKVVEVFMQIHNRFQNLNIK